MNRIYTECRECLEKSDNTSLVKEDTIEKKNYLARILAALAALLMFVLFVLPYLKSGKQNIKNEYIKNNVQQK